MFPGYDGVREAVKEREKNGRDGRSATVGESAPPADASHGAQRWRRDEQSSARADADDKGVA
jgi:hypothetical protein